MNKWAWNVLPLLLTVSGASGCSTTEDSSELASAVAVVQETFPSITRNDAVNLLDRMCDIADAAGGSTDELAVGLAYFGVASKRSTDQVFRLFAASVQSRCPQNEYLLR